MPERFQVADLWSLKAVEMGHEEESDFCLWPVEEAFPAEARREMDFRNLEASLSRVDELDEGKSDRRTAECAVEAKSLPRGTVPGV